MNLLTYDEILRTLIIGLIAAADILIAYWLGARVFEKQVKTLEAEYVRRRNLRTD